MNKDIQFDVAYEQDPAATANYMAGRQGHVPSMIVLHSMDGFMAGTIQYFATPRPANPTSAHYSIGWDGNIAQHVDERDTAYHAGDWITNLISIGIEHEDQGVPYIQRSDSLYATSARLVADICKRYSIPCDSNHIKIHSEVSDNPTACPTGLDRDRIVAAANQILNPPPPPTEEWNRQIHMIEPIIFSLHAPLNWYNFIDGSIAKTDQPGNNITVVAKTDVFKGSTYYLTQYSVDNQKTVGAKEEDLYANGSVVQPAPVSTDPQPAAAPAPAPAVGGADVQQHTVTILPDAGANIRTTPNSTDQNVAKTLPKGTVIPVETAVVGDAPAASSNNMWWKIQGEDLYVWTGVTSEVPPSTSPVTPATPTPDPASQVQVDQTTADNAKLVQTIADLRSQLNNTNGQLTDLTKKNAGLENDMNDYLILKKANQLLSDQIKIYKDKNTAATVQAFTGWEMFDLPQGKALLARIGLALKLFLLPSNAPYVVGWKSNMKLTKVGDQKAGE